jgi:hypothetical protein
MPTIQTIHDWQASGATDMPIVNGFACWYANHQGYV